MKRRSGEKVKAWFRSERFYHTGQGWYFMTREGEEYGPFDTEHDADSELMLYIRSVNMCQNSIAQASDQLPHS